MGNTLYDRDFYAWANEQAGLLRAGRLSEADIDHIAEEIESMGKSEKRELVSRLAILLLHLLKWNFQPERRTNSWRNSVEVQRVRLDSHMRDNPSLKSSLGEAIVEAFRVARLEAESETGLDRSVFPAVCPWTFEQMMDETFWPEPDDHAQ
jgi:hypothetical protein